MYPLYKTHINRRPVWFGPRLGLQDLQGALPRGWCSRCGCEVFALNTERCFRCNKEELNDVF